MLEYDAFQKEPGQLRPTFELSWELADPLTETSRGLPGTPCNTGTDGELLEILILISERQLGEPLKPTATEQKQRD